MTNKFEEKRYRIVINCKRPQGHDKNWAAWWRLEQYSLKTYSTLNAAKGNITRALGKNEKRINIPYEIQEIIFVGEWKTVVKSG